MPANLKLRFTKIMKPKRNSRNDAITLRIEKIMGTKGISGFHISTRDQIPQGLTQISDRPENHSPCFLKPRLPHNILVVIWKAKKPSVPRLTKIMKPKRNSRDDAITLCIEKIMGTKRSSRGNTHMLPLEIEKIMGTKGISGFHISTRNQIPQGLTQISDHPAHHPPCFLKPRLPRLGTSR